MSRGPLVWLTALFCYYRIVVSGLLTQLPCLSSELNGTSAWVS